MPRVAKNTVAEDQVKPEPMEGGASNGERKQPAWLTKIKEGGVVKIPKDVQKRRRNFRLGKLLIPKPPMMVLMEIVKQNEVVFEKYILDPVSRLLKVTATYDGKTFEGVGPTKNIAKNICSESILQYIAFKACQKDQTGEAPKGSHGEEETPWTALASVALFKMFNDWQAQGADIPHELMRGAARPHPGPAANLAEDVKMETFGGAPAPKKVVKRQPPKDKPLPADAATRNPVQILNEMQGSLDYQTTVEGMPPNSIYTMSVTINNQTFTGSARSKKEAKKNCAIAAMFGIYQVRYAAS